MTLPAPRLDDRTFQELVDEAKRRIARLCPEWTDHNVSDPGVALIELYAWMTELMLYRLNKVPDRLYVKFLELAGIELATAAPARVDLVFRLSAAQDAAVRIPQGTQVSTERHAKDEPVVFMSREDLDIVPPEVTSCLTHSEGAYVDHWETLRREAAPVVCFRTLREGDAFYLGFSGSLAANLVRLHVLTGIEGEGADPSRPPYVWESWDGSTWRPARVLRDESLALNTTTGGDIELLLAPRHEPLTLFQQRAHWLRCKLVVTDGPTYRQSPELHALRVTSVGGAVEAHNAELAPPEALGVSDGTPGQVFSVRRRPVLRRSPEESVQVVTLSPEDGAERIETWTEVVHFAHAGEADRVFTWSGSSGEIRFGPALLDRDGRLRQHGAIPPADARIRTTGYRHGGGARGNVPAGKLTVTRTAIPFVRSVTNLDPARGGVDAETVENAKIRGPLTLRSGDRAVTPADFERLALEADRSVARARCVPPVDGGPVRVLIVPRVHVEVESLALSDLALPAHLIQAVSRYLDDRRLLTTQVQIDEPSYRGVMVVAELRADAGLRSETIRESAQHALFTFVNPLVGGTDHRGWPFAKALVAGDVHALLQAVPGVESVESVYLFAADLRTGEFSDEPQARLVPPPDTLFMSAQHQVVVR